MAGKNSHFTKTFTNKITSKQLMDAPRKANILKRQF